uniref:Uncharacterized protein n=1 Tax=Palpitomonas bilix TaxID=652834 RepID=A0A7S3D9M2_9EUKA|mmetsp:Transcript_28112/g.71669  ORF Transcript_28112/g.71669 Transcript_28112/m.71669 type:complete len:189 (+) Transcript_28112:176-742(+)
MRVAICSTLLVLCLAFASVHSKEQPRRGLRDEEVDKLPDRSDPVVKRRLQCNACQVSCSELFDSLSSLKKRRGGKPKTYELIDAMESTCSSITNYGLQLRRGVPTEIFSKNVTISRATGGYITRYLMLECGEIIEENEDVVVAEVMKKSFSERSLMSAVCIRERKECKVVGPESGQDDRLPKDFSKRD